MYIITLVTKILHFLKLKYKESNLQDSMQQCNYTTDGIFNLHMGCLSVYREIGGGGIVYHQIQRTVYCFRVIHGTDIH